MHFVDAVVYVVVAMLLYSSCREYQREWQNNGVSVVLWTVNDPAEKDYFGRVLKCPIMTDCVGSSSQQSAP